MYNTKDIVKTFHGTVIKKYYACNTSSPIGSDESTMIASYVPSGAFLKNSTAERKEIFMELEFTNCKDYQYLKQ